MKTKKILTVFMVLLVSMSFMSFTNADDISNQNQNFSISENKDFDKINNSNEADGSWIFAWSDGISGILAWES